MVKVSYSIYCLYTNDNEIYIGLSKNPRVRIEQHIRKSCNYRLRKLFEEGNKEIFSTILHSGLTQEQASQLEKVLIKKYKEDPDYTILNIQSGGIRGGAKITKSPKISNRENTKHLSDEQIIAMRYKYSVRDKIEASKECILYNIGSRYFTKILKGQARRNLAGPRLGKEYNIG